MSRSRRKFPRCSVAMKGNEAGQMKAWKKSCSRSFRRNLPAEDEVPNGNKYRRLSGDIWNSPSDGKWMCKDPKLMRK